MRSGLRLGFIGYVMHLQTISFVHSVQYNAKRLLLPRPYAGIRYIVWHDSPGRLTRLPHSALVHLKSCALPDIRSPMMSPKRPKTELKISMTSIFTNLEEGFWSESRSCWGLAHGLQRRICSVCQSSAASVDAHRNATYEVTHANQQASPEQCVASEVTVPRI